MKKIIAAIMALIIVFACCSAAFADSGFLVGEWSTSDGTKLTFYDDGTFTMKWFGSFLSESGKWSAPRNAGNCFVIEMDGSSILAVMSFVYGKVSEDYHFEIIKCNEDNFYLVQVYGDKTAVTSPCKLGFTRVGCTADLTIPDVLTSTSVMHTVRSSDENDREFRFKENEEVEDLLFSEPWGSYDPRLAHFLAVMARAAYDQHIIEENYSELGFKDVVWEYEQTLVARFSLARKRLSDGTLLYFVAIKGSDSPFENIEQWLGTNADIGLTSDNWHEGFTRSAENVYYRILRDLGGSIDDNTVFIITGHSLGAATANLLSVMLIEGGVPNDHVYDYNFACPNVAVGKTDSSVWNGNGKYNGIISVENRWDIVASVPTNDLFNFSDVRWKRFGQSFWFEGSTMLGKLKAHDMLEYIGYLCKEYDESRFISSEYAVTAVSVRCPVDVEVFGGSGAAVAGVVSDTARYYGDDIGAHALIITDGDCKTIYLLDDDSFDVRLTATGVGSMDYSVCKVDLNSGNVLERKDFSSVELTPDKQMSSNIGRDTAVSDVRLYVNDGSGDRIKEVLADGSEVSATGSSTNNEGGAPQQGEDASEGNASFLAKHPYLIGVAVVALVLIILIIATASSKRKA